MLATKEKRRRFRNGGFRVPVVLLAAVLAFSSCKDFLNVDNYFSDELKLDSVFKEKRYVEAYLWGISGMFTDEGTLFQGPTPGPLATDEGFSTMFSGSDYGGVRYVMGDITASNLYAFNHWDNMYKIIRKCNILLSRMDEAPDITTVERFGFIGNIRFMRAYAYYNLLVDMGPPVLLGDEVVENNETLEYYDRPRATYDEAVEYICSELEEAAKYLLPTVPIMNFGRPTQGAAYGLIARLRLIHASPLFNGGQAARSAFGNWRRKTDNVLYVSQEYKEERWALAAAAAQRVIDMGIYKLYTVTRTADTKPLPTIDASVDPDYNKTFEEGGAADIDHFRSYAYMFNGEAVAQINPEYIWGRPSYRLGYDTRKSFPNTFGGWNNAAVTQKVVDAYAVYDGRTIAEATGSTYSETGFTSVQENFSGYRLNANVYNMYANREMRFYASIGFSECFWPMMSTTVDSKRNQTVSYHIGGNNDKYSSSDPNNYPPTGYVIKKFIHPMDAYDGDNANQMSKVFPIIRYAEILLSYAEALNNLTGSHTVELGGRVYMPERDMDKIRQAFNQVRHRAGLPGMTVDEANRSETVQQLIEKERLVEFLFENRRYYDVRRWGKYEESEREPIMGMNVEGNRDSYYRRTVPSTRIGARIINRRLLLTPIPLAEVRRLPSLDQNPGWEE
jgi:hypothetical protein